MGDDSASLTSRVVDKLNGDKLLTGVIKRGSDGLLADTPYYISTQCAVLDYMIGRPGIPASKMTTLFGLEGSSKSTIVYHLLAEVQQMGGIGVLIDSEQRFTKDRAARIGLNADELIIVDGATTEQSFDAIEKIATGVRAEHLDIPVVIAYDSLAGSVSEKRMEAEVGGVVVAQVARLASAMIPRIKLKLAHMGVALVMVNQLRSRVNFGDDPRTSRYQERQKVLGPKHSMLAERTLLYESALMLHTTSVSMLGEDREHPTGIRARATNRKCGISPREGWQAEFDIDFMNGIDREQADFDLLEEIDIIKHTSAGWYAIRGADGQIDPDQKKFQRKDFARVLSELPHLRQFIKDAPTLWKGVKGEIDVVQEV